MHIPMQGNTNNGGGEGISGGGNDNAAAEFEEELQRGGPAGHGRGVHGGEGGSASPMVLNVLGSTGGGKVEGPGPPTSSPTQRAAAVRELCVSALGPVLFEVRVFGVNVDVVVGMGVGVSMSMGVGVSVGLGGRVGVGVGAGALMCVGARISIFKVSHFNGRCPPGNVYND